MEVARRKQNALVVIVATAELHSRRTALNSGLNIRDFLFDIYPPHFGIQSCEALKLASFNDKSGEGLI